MSVRLVTDRAEVRTLLHARVAHDPVTGTVLGTIHDALDRPEVDPWCATSSAGGLAVRSQPEYPALLDGDWPESDLDDLVAALSGVPGLVGLGGPAEIVESVASRLDGLAPLMTLRLHRLDTLSVPASVEGRARRAEAPDRDLVVDWYRAFGREAHMDPPDVLDLVDRALAERGCWLWLDPTGMPVSLATRQPVVAASARIGPVYTPPECRGRGYGSAVTAAATQDILDEGAIPVLFTDLANPTSNKIYAALGYRAVEDRTTYRFRSSG